MSGSLSRPALNSLYQGVFGEGSDIPILTRWQQAEKTRQALELPAAEVLPRAYADLDEFALRGLLATVLTDQQRQRVVRGMMMRAASRAVKRVKDNLHEDLPEVQQLLQCCADGTADTVAALRVREIHLRYFGAPWEALRVLECALKATDHAELLTQGRDIALGASRSARTSAEAEDRQLTADAIALLAAVLDGAS